MFSLLKPKKCALALLGSGILAFGLYNIHALSGVTEGGVLGMTLFLHHWIGLSPALSGCGAFPAESGVTEAVLGETVSTRWFDCTVEEAEARKSYESDTASGGNKLVVVELELKNTFHEAVSMYDTDFQLYWGECGPDEWAMPLDPYCEDQLPREYDLEPGKSREGLLVYEVPQEETEFTLAFLELIENGTEEGEEGDLFLTRFTVE